MHKPAHILKLLSESAHVMFYRLYTDQLNRYEEAENYFFNLVRTKEEKTFVNLLNSVFFRDSKTVTMDSELEQNLRKGRQTW